MEEIVPPVVECGFCLRQGVALPNPRQLPCNHVHCHVCLTGFYDENNILICPWEDCRVVCEVPLDKLPSHDVTKNKPKSCDPCTKKGQDNQHAFSYCPQCDKIFCVKHHESHQEYQEEFGEPHRTINMEQYELLRSQQSRVCADHDNKPISLGCRKCLKMSCLGCVSSMGACSEGEPHQLMSLEELVLLLNDEINKLKKGMIEKEEGLERIFKFTSQTLADYDMETAQSVEKIHKKRDEQMELLSLKYKQLEEEFQESRLKTKTCITDFLEDEVLVKWSRLRNLRHKVDSRAQHAHQQRLTGCVQEELSGEPIFTHLVKQQKTGSHIYYEQKQQIMDC
ncbi:transcription intermediary factor 1-beta-like [Watersipora subatra]|uniref:transcription intermediary factor 1-beta-like n=1 Tax=Watersipora subatra TaxID=2589382 RepID=UPI00355C032C